MCSQSDEKTFSRNTVQQPSTMHRIFQKRTMGNCNHTQTQTVTDLADSSTPVFRSRTPALQLLLRWTIFVWFKFGRSHTSIVTPGTSICSCKPRPIPFLLKQLLSSPASSIDFSLLLVIQVTVCPDLPHVLHSSNIILVLQLTMCPKQQPYRICGKQVRMQDHIISIERPEFLYGQATLRWTGRQVAANWTGRQH